MPAAFGAKAACPPRWAKPEGCRGRHEGRQPMADFPIRSMVANGKPASRISVGVDVGRHDFGPLQPKGMRRV
jgi:hypothetical protein